MGHSSLWLNGGDVNLLGYNIGAVKKSKDFN
jgi:hypothetical protein